MIGENDRLPELDPDTLMFFDGHRAALPLYAALEAVITEKYPDAKIVARREKTNWKYSFEDNYMRYYMQDKLEEYMHNTAEEYFGECKVFVDFSIYHCLPESFPTDATAEDFLKHESLFNFDVIISPENITYGKARKGYKELEIALEKEFEEYSRGYIDVCVYYALDAETFEKTESYDDSTGEDAIGNKDNYRYVGRIGFIGMAR